MNKKTPIISPNAQRPAPLRRIKKTEAEIEHSKNINEAISLFEDLLPGEFVSGAAYKKAGTRQAVEGMLTTYSVPELRKMVENFTRRRFEQYAPTVGTIYEFCTFKRAKVESFLNKKESGLKAFHGEKEGQVAADWQLRFLKK